MPPSNNKQTAAAIADNTEIQVSSLVADLASPNPIVRTKARAAIVAMGKARKAMAAARKLTVPALIRLPSHSKPHVRWEAAKRYAASPTRFPPPRGERLGRPRPRRAVAGRRGRPPWGGKPPHPLLAALLQRNSGSLCMLEASAPCAPCPEEEEARSHPAAGLGGYQTIRAGSCRASRRLRRTVETQ